MLQTAANEAAVTQLTHSTLSERPASVFHNKLQCIQIEIAVPQQSVQRLVMHPWVHKVDCNRL